MLDELAKRDKDWRKMAFQICKDRSLSDDLVQDMYLKFANYSKPLNDYYIFFAIRSIFLDQIKKSKLQLSEIELENVSLKDDEYCFESDLIADKVFQEVERLPYFEKELLKVTQTISQRELSRQTDISLNTIKKTIQKTKEQLKEKLWQDQKR